MEIQVPELIELVDAALSADYTRVRRAASNVARLAESADPDAARALRALIRKKGVPLRASGYTESLPVDSKSRLPLVEEHPWPSTPLFLDDKVKSQFETFIAHARHSDLLSSNGLSSRLSLLLSGPPGTGKTLLAGHIAAQLDRNLYSVRLDSIISSLLGDTAKNVRNIFEYVPSRDGVLFLDEVDAVAKLRDDRHELGELKRVVNTVIQSLDALDDRAIVIAATNHSHLLDPAIFRRFPYRIELGLPDTDVRKALWASFLSLHEESPEGAWLLAQISDGLSGASIEEISLAERRQALLSGQATDLAQVAWAVLNSTGERLVLPEGRNLTPDQKRALAQKLVLSGAARPADVARLLNVTRQAIGKYLKGFRDG